ncbi:MAG: hypothetical protein AAF387_21065 [Pseudomonadota bacterium]
MTLYENSEWCIDSAVAEIHENELLSFSQTGAWWSAIERFAIALESRNARCEAGTQAALGNENIHNKTLTASTKDYIKSIALGGMEIDRYFAEEAIEELGEERYVELVGIVARLAHLDIFAKGIGISPLALLEPTDDVSPPQQRPSEAKDEGFFVASVPPAPDGGGDLARWIYGGDFPAANILRSLSLVPEEARRLNTIIDQEYCSMTQIMDMEYSPQPPLSRPQVELIAARVSALNDCFY